MVTRSLLLLLLIVFVHSNVVVLDDSNYTSFIQEHPYVFVKYYAPWCGHCKSMAPDYEKLALESAGKEYVIAKVDATQAKKTAEEAGVDGYPTLKFIVQGHSIDYQNERNFDAMLSWLDVMMQSEIKKVDENQIKEFIGSQNFLLIQGASQEQLKLIRFGKVEGVEYYALDGADFKVTLYLKNTKTLEYTGSLDLKELSSWVFANTMSSLVTMSSSEAIKYVFQNEGKLPSFLLLRHKDWTDELSDSLTEICGQNKQKFMCAWAGEQHQIYQGVNRFLKAEGNEHSILAYFDYGINNGWKVNDPTTFTKQSLAQFIEDVNAGKIQKFHDGQQAKENKEGGQRKKIEYNHVLQLTNDNYNSTLKDNAYVFVEYYSPTCGHCVQFAPVYQAFAEQMKAEESKYIIAAVDMAKQEQINQYVSVNGYPSLRFYVNGVEFDYEGERKGENIKQWMDKVVETKLEVIESIEKLERPGVAVFGIAQDSPLQRLAVKFTKYPVKAIPADSFKIQIHENKYSQYTGDQNIDAVYNWLEQKTQEILINVAEPTTSKKLNKALENQTPILLLINRDNSAQQKIVKDFLTSFCEDKLEYVCGIANKGDKQYDAFNDWIQDPIKDKSRLLYLTTEKFEKFLYEDSLADISREKIEEFIKLVKAGSVTAHGADQGQAQEGEQVEASETDPNAPEGSEGSEAQVEAENAEVVQEQGEPAPESFEATDL